MIWLAIVSYVVLVLITPFTLDPDPTTPLFDDDELDLLGP